MSTIEVSARTTEEAISEGLEKLGGVTISDVKVEVLEEGSKGLFGLFGSRPAKVRLTVIEEEEDSEVKAIFSETPKKPEAPKSKKTPAPKAEKAEKTEKTEKPVKAEKPAETAEKPQKPKKEAQAPKQEKTEKPQEEKPAKPAKAPRKPKTEKPAETNEKKSEKAAEPVTPAEQLDPETPAGQAQVFLLQLTKLIGVDVAVHAGTDEEGNVRVEMQGDSLGILIGRRGETLDALQYLTSLQVNKGQSEYTRVTLDTENYRAKREEALIRLANRMANRAQKTGKRVSLEPMNPYERRILHSALQNNEAVETHSEGEEPNRHIVITLKK